VSSKGIEWSFVWLNVGIVGMVFLFFALLGTKSDENTPTYERDSQVTPRPLRIREDSDRPAEVGTPENTESS
jgi:hypothetical protein